MIIKHEETITTLVLILEKVLHREQFDEKHRWLIVCFLFVRLSKYELEETTLFLEPLNYASMRLDAVKLSPIFFSEHTAQGRYRSRTKRKIPENRKSCSLCTHSGPIFTQ